MKISLCLLKSVTVFAIFMVILLSSSCLGGPENSELVEPKNSEDATEYDWRTDWALIEGFSLEMDSQGFSFPTALAFIQEPGNLPKDPLYFVTELRGKIKIVTNDRTVLTFADNLLNFLPEEELPSLIGVVGLIGICLDPAHGYVFATFAYQSPDGYFRNNVVRFDSEPGTFSSNYTSQIVFTDVFSGSQSAFGNASGHQIGPCQVKDDLLYVSVGDGDQPHKAQQLDSALGKILRMTLDGKPVESNPFQSEEAPTNYVWAYGLRNPFGLKAVGEKLFAADNGIDVDRFVEVNGGGDYFFDGTDYSISANTIFLFNPARGVSQVDFNPKGSTVLPKRFEESFFLVISGKAEIHDPDEPPEIVILRYSLAQDRLVKLPETFLRYVGSNLQALTGATIGHDGLYFAGLYPNRDGLSGVFRVSFNPQQSHGTILAETINPEKVMRNNGCFGCHTVEDNIGGNAGPLLDRKPLIQRLEQRLNSDEYVQSISEIDSLDREPFNEFHAARQEVLEAVGQEKIETWIKYRVLEPRFDNSDAIMPNLGVSDTDARLIAEYLVSEYVPTEPLATEGIVVSQGLVYRTMVLLRIPDRIRIRHLLFSFAGGLSAGVVGVSIVLWGAIKIRTRLRERNSDGPDEF